MKKEEFAALFQKASDFAINAARLYVTDVLPPERRFFLNINEAYEDLKPTESTHAELAMASREYWGPKLDGEIVDRIWIDGAVPVWIDISVYRSDSDFTYLDLDACNRFSREPTDYYYEDRNMGPFGVKSPAFPPRWEDSKGKFSLTERVKLFHHMRTELG
jgi:hypothetical protein